MLMVPGALRVTVLILSSLLSVNIGSSLSIGRPDQPYRPMDHLTPSTAISQCFLPEPQVVQPAAGRAESIEVGLGLEPVELTTELEHVTDSHGVDVEIGDDPDIDPMGI